MLSSRKARIMKQCETCEYCGEYTIYGYKVCWLMSDDEVMFIDDIEEGHECEDYKEKKNDSHGNQVASVA